MDKPNQYDLARERAIEKYVLLQEEERRKREALTNLPFRVMRSRPGGHSAVPELRAALWSRDEEIACLTQRIFGLERAQKQHMKRKLANPYAWLGATGREDELDGPKRTCIPPGPKTH